METAEKQERLDEASAGVLALLANPASYTEQTSRVERIDTHISWVFLTDRFVYKLKKPVRYDFLDFSTPQQRRWACEQEVRLNRRLARDIYIGVVPVTEKGHQRLQLDGSGNARDWVVKMHRLPADRALSELIRSGKVTETEVNELARRLSDFYQGLPPVSIHVERYRRQIADHIAGNKRFLSEVDLDINVVKRVNTAQARLLRLASEVIDSRVCDGRIVDGHGDLRPEHIYFNPHPTIIDAIEFNDEFRQIDVLDELAFLAAECEHLNAAWIGDRVLEKYQATSVDHFPPVLLDFYKTYRACVRAKVCALRATQVPRELREPLIADARRYLELADRHAAQLGSPTLLVVYGLPGTGKSTLAQQLADELQIDGLETDAIRRELFGERAASAEYNEGIYQPEMRTRVYGEMFRRAEKMLASRLSVILDGTFPTARLRRQATELARRHKAAPLLVRCHCKPDSARQRIDARTAAGRSLSDATPEIYERQRLEHEADPDDLPVCQVDTESGLTKATEPVVAALRRRLGL